MDTIEHFALGEAPPFIENRPFDDLKIGQTARLARAITQSDIELFAAVSGDVNPAHLDARYADATLFHGIIAHGMLGGSLFSTILGTMLPGPGTIYISQDLRFRHPVKPGDILTASVVVQTADAETKRVVLDCVCVNQDGKDVITGTAEVIAPTEKIRRPRVALPDVCIIHHEEP
jgi:acyl dehydratase